MRLNPLIAAATGIGIGAAAAYLLDPERGRTRRARIADQTAAAGRRLVHRGRQLARLQAGRLSGRVAEVRHIADVQPVLDDASLAQKLETKLFRSAKVPKGSININVEQGVAVLRGEVADAELRGELEAVALRVPGIGAVRKLLHAPEGAAPATS
jgi:osmotically-inducible protein OsmY